MKKRWIHKADSFNEAQEFEDRYYMEESPEERLSDMQFCREQYFRIKGINNASRKRLRRIIRVIQ